MNIQAEVQASYCHTYDINKKLLQKAVRDNSEHLDCPFV
jgi:hypothetical protein